MRDKALLFKGKHIEIDYTAVFSPSPEQNWQPAMVMDMLSTQFTALIDNHIQYYFYKDRGVTWRIGNGTT